MKKLVKIIGAVFALAAGAALLARMISCAVVRREEREMFED